MAAKYKEYFKKMLDENKNVFESFMKLHNEYEINQEKLQDRFNKEGEKILEIIREYENRLCTNTERGMYNKFSVNLAEKFQKKVKKHFPLIDHVGLKISHFPVATEKAREFIIKKIKLL